MRNRKVQFRDGFTLLEVLVVAIVVVLMLGMALPVFRAITGSRSEAGATNHITAMIARARTDAIGLQKTMGVAFINNTNSQVEEMAEVELADCPAFSPATAYNPGNYASVTTGVGVTTYYICTAYQAASLIPPPTGNWKAVGGPPLEIRQDTDVIPLPTGVGVETVCNCGLTGGARTSDGYLSFGVILFDGLGRMVCQNYGVSSISKLAVNSGLGGDYPVPLGSTPIVYPVGSNNSGVPSQFGLVVFQRDAFTVQKSPTIDPFYTQSSSNQQSVYQGTGLPTQQSEENWLDQNATPLVIDRYTGDLIKAE